VIWRVYVKVDWELDRAEGGSVTGEKYELPPRSVGDRLPLENCVCSERGGSGIGNLGGRPLDVVPEPPLPPVADLVLRLVLEPFLLTENSETENTAASLAISSSASYSC
jgi:hypothetical protein